MNWTIEDEKVAKEEYLSMIGTLRTTDELKSEWKGEWETYTKEVFGRKVSVKGDKHKYMLYWIENQKIINDSNWNKIEKEEEYGDF